MQESDKHFFQLVGQTYSYPNGAIFRWNPPLPIVAETLGQVLGIQPTFPSIHDGNTAVLYDAISFYRLPSNLDCI